MNDEDYGRAVQSLASDEHEKIQRISHWVLGLTSEAGEVADVLKRFLFYGKEGETLDHYWDDFAEEMGDLYFYLTALRMELSLSMSCLRRKNIQKLEARYKGRKFSREAARARADK